MTSTRFRFVLGAVAIVAAACSDVGGGGGGGGGGKAQSYRFDGAADCSTDVAPQLNELIVSVPDGATVTFAPEACHRIDGTVLIADKRAFTLAGGGVRFEAPVQGEDDRKHFDVEGGENIVVRDLTLVGPHPEGGPAGYVPELASQHGFNFGGVEGVTISNVTITDIYGDFLRFGQGGGKGGEENRWSRNIVVTDSRFERNGRQGVSFTGAADVVIEDNSISDVARSVFDIEPNSAGGGAQRLRLAENDLANWGNLVLPIGGKGEVSDIELVNNHLDGKLDVLVKDPRTENKAENDGGGVRRTNILIIGNVATAPSGNASVNLTRVDGALIRGNRQSFESDTEAVKVIESCDVTIEDNQFEGMASLVTQDDYICE